MGGFILARRAASPVSNRDSLVYVPRAYSAFHLIFISLLIFFCILYSLEKVCILQTCRPNLPTIASLLGPNQPGFCFSVRLVTVFSVSTHRDSVHNLVPSLSTCKSCYFVFVLCRKIWGVKPSHFMCSKKSAILEKVYAGIWPLG